MRGSRKFCQRESNSDVFFVCFFVFCCCCFFFWGGGGSGFVFLKVDEGRVDPNTTKTGHHRTAMNAGLLAL